MSTPQENDAGVETTTTTPSPTTPMTTTQHKVPIRPSQRQMEQTYTSSIETLAQCDEEYCEDAEAKYHAALLYYVLKEGKDEWNPVINHQLNQDEPALEKHLNLAFKRYDANKNVQQSLNTYRLNRWRNPLINYDARKFRSPLYYRGAPDLWRRLHQTKGRPTLLQCLDFAPYYQKLKKKYEQTPDHLRLERQYTLALFDSKVCIPGLQCPGLRPFMLWCMQNPAATPTQVEECLTSLPRFVECGKPGYIPPSHSLEENAMYIGETTVGTTRAQLEAGRRLKEWVLKAEAITAAKRPEEEPVEKTKNDLRREFVREERLDQLMEGYPRYSAAANIVPNKRPVVKRYEGSETEDNFEDVYQYDEPPQPSRRHHNKTNKNTQDQDNRNDGDDDNNNDYTHEQRKEASRAKLRERYRDTSSDLLPLSRRRIPGMDDDNNYDEYGSGSLTSKAYLNSILQEENDSV